MAIDFKSGKSPPHKSIHQRKRKAKLQEGEEEEEQAVMDPPQTQHSRSLVLNCDKDDAARVPSERRDETNSIWANFIRPLRSAKLANDRIIIGLSMSGCILDCLFFYSQVIHHHQKCIRYDKALVITTIVLRTVNDFGLSYFAVWRNELFSDAKIKFNKAIKDFASELKMLRPHRLHAIFSKGFACKINKRRLYRYSIIFSCLPIPQVTWLTSFKKATANFRGKTAATGPVATSILASQNIFRFLAVLAWTLDAIISGKLYEWIVMFCFYTLYFSQVTGVIWYNAALYTVQGCWFNACTKRNKEKDCQHYLAAGFLCSWGYKADNFTTEFCSVNSTNYEFGMIDEAGQSGILLDSNSGFTRIIYGLRWGLQSLSSFGQNHRASADVKRNIFTIIVILLGMLLFFFFLGQLQVEEFQGWSDASLEELCDRVKPTVYVERTQVFREGEPINEMVFVVKGVLWPHPSQDRTTTSSSICGRNHRSDHLKAIDLCGKELVNWVRTNPYSSYFPISARTIQAVTNVEAFVILAYDLKKIVIKHQVILFLQFRWRFVRHRRSRRNAETPAPKADIANTISVVTRA